MDVIFSNKRVRKNFKSTSTVLSKYFRKYCRSTSKVLSKYFGSFYDLPEIKLAEASIFLLKDFSQISKKRETFINKCFFGHYDIAYRHLRANFFYSVCTGSSKFPGPSSVL